MHPIIRDSAEGELFYKHFASPEKKIVRLDITCGRKITALGNFISELWNHRMKCHGLGVRRFSNEIVDVNWNWDQPLDFCGPDEGRTTDAWEYTNNKKDINNKNDRDHKNCLKVDGHEGFCKSIMTLGARDENGKYPWRPLVKVLDDFNDTLTSLESRVLRMADIVHKNGGELNIHSYCYSMGNALSFNVEVSCALHVFDPEAEESCPYYSGIPTGVIEE